MRTLLLDHAERATLSNSKTKARPKQRPTSRPKLPTPNPTEPKLSPTLADQHTMMLMKLMPSYSQLWRRLTLPGIMFNFCWKIETFNSCLKSSSGYGLSVLLFYGVLQQPEADKNTKKGNQIKLVQKAKLKMVNSFCAYNNFLILCVSFHL